ncbi:MAG: hypothetical protein ACXW0Q_07405 [Methylovulum sp.]
MISYNIEIQFKGEPAFELIGVPAYTTKDAKRRALTQARDLGYRAGVAKITARRQS